MRLWGLVIALSTGCHLVAPYSSTSGSFADRGADQVVVDADRGAPDDGLADEAAVADDGPSPCEDGSRHGECSLSSPAFRCENGQLVLACEPCCPAGATCSGGAAPTACEVSLISVRHACVDKHPGSNGASCNNHKPQQVVTAYRWNTYDEGVALLDFGVRDAIPRQASILSAEFRLAVAVFADDQDVPVSISVIQRPWDESTLDYVAAAALPLSESVVEPALKINDVNTVGASLLVSACLGGLACHGFHFGIPGTTTGKMAGLAHEQHDNAAWWPRLVVTYSISSGT